MGGRRGWGMWNHLLKKCGETFTSKKHKMEREYDDQKFLKKKLL